MEQRHKEILEELNEKLTDIDVDNGIIEFLQDNGILTDEDIAGINRETNGIVKANVLLSIIPNRGSRAFDVFYQAIKKHYPWLSDEMLRMTSNGEPRACTSPILPIIPSLTVDRAEKVQQLKDALRELSPGRYIVLHGMKGYGRSRLIASTLEDPLIRTELFNNKIHWIKFGSDGLVEDEILNQLQQLYDTIENRDVALNIGKQQAEMQLMLKRHFHTQSNRESLLILYDVYDRKIIDAFNFDCKILIITTDIEILPPNHTGRDGNIIKMTEGFTEAESLELFARALGTRVELLPSEAKDFHHACKGMPIMIDMFAAQFADYKEDMKRNGERWKYYLDLLKKQDPSNEIVQKFLSYQANTFDICIDRLSEEQRNFYESLAIFSEDINIMAKTLGVYWDMSPYKADEIMNSLHKKSLIVKYWNPDLGSHIYGVHDLLLSHLRNRINKKTPERLRLMHRKFVNKNYNYCRNDFSNFPQDNYSYAYIGHHLDQAQMFEDFPQLYLNFDFIQAKIRHSGVNDLLIDLKKYRDHITNYDNEAEKKVDDLNEFLQIQAKTLAEHRQRNCLDLVQIALNHHTRGYCYETARSLAKSQKTKLYLKNSHQHSVMPNQTAEDIKMEYSTLNFTDNPNKILIGTKTGLIMLWDSEVKKRIRFCGLEDAEIVKVIVSQNGQFFVAFNKDSVIKYFTLTIDDDNEDNNNYQAHHSHTPFDKQTFWYPILEQQTNHSLITYKTNGEVITDIALSSDDKKLAACTTKGNVSVWDINGKPLMDINEPNKSFQKLTFARKAQQLHVIDTKGTNFAYVLKEDNTHSCYRYNPFRRDSGKCSVDENVIYFKERLGYNEEEQNTHLICLTSEHFFLMSWRVAQNGQLFQPESQCKYSAIDVKFTVAVLTYDSNYLMVGSSDNLLSVIKIDGGFEPIVNYPERTFALDTYYDYECQCHLIISGDKHSIQRWTFCPENLPQSVLRPLFDAIMKPLNESNIVAQEIVGNKIGLYNGETLTVETGPLNGQIISLNLSPEGNKILYAVKQTKLVEKLKVNKYTVYLFDIETNETSEVLSSLEEFPGFVKFIKYLDKLAMVCKQNNYLYYILDNQIKKIETGNIVNLHTINDEYVVSVTRDEQVKLWRMNTSTWDFVYEIGGTTNLHEMQQPYVFYSAINLVKNMVATLISNCRLAIYEVGYNKAMVPAVLRKFDDTYFVFSKKLKCCAFSPDDKVLALGMEDGSITIFDLRIRTAHPNELSLHQNSILQLHWAPSEVGAPILLSINCDELAWWNVALIEDDSKKKVRRSRMGVVKSLTVPLFDFKSRSDTQMRNSFTADANLSIASTSKATDNFNYNNNYSNNNVSNGNDINGNDTRDNGENQQEIPKHWISKTYKNQNRTALLGLIRLPPNCRAKVSVSSDFYKFLLVDVNGSIKCFELFEVSTDF